MKKLLTKERYPEWICSECARANGGYWPENHIGSFHKEICGWCEQEKDVTEPRDWKYPKAPKNNV